ncbi:MAG: hypothetical protein RR620_11955 [Clostridium sp.]
MAKKKIYTGFTPETVENLILDVGVFFKDFEVGTDTFETAVKAGKLIGATKGGGSFTAKPSIIPLEIDGLKNNTKGAKLIDDYEVAITANTVEVTPETIKLALIACKVTESETEGYDKITASESISLEDYIKNITWVGTLSGNSKPVIIQVFNALNQDGLSLTPEKKGQAVVALNFIGHYDVATLEEPPFAIYYPKKETQTKEEN